VSLDLGVVVRHAELAGEPVERQRRERQVDVEVPAELQGQGQVLLAERAYVAQGLRPLARKEREGWLRIELARP